MAFNGQELMFFGQEEQKAKWNQTKKKWIKNFKYQGAKSKLTKLRSRGVKWVGIK